MLFLYESLLRAYNVPSCRVDESHLQVVVIVEHAAWVDNRKTACFPFSFPSAAGPLGYAAAG